MQAASPFAYIVRLQFIYRLLPLADFLMRLYVSKVFFLAGLSKLRDWNMTISLFVDEYHVPFLPPELAAYLATAAELALPVLLLFGVARHFAAIGLFLLNLVAVISYYHVLQDLPAALQDHAEWGLMLLILSSISPTFLCLDYHLAQFKKQT
jgi:putative oxidoreductase